MKRHRLEFDILAEYGSYETAIKRIKDLQSIALKHVGRSKTRQRNRGSFGRELTLGELEKKSY